MLYFRKIKCWQLTFSHSYSTLPFSFSPPWKRAKCNLRHFKVSKIFPGGACPQNPPLKVCMFIFKMQPPHFTLPIISSDLKGVGGGGFVLPIISSDPEGRGVDLLYLSYQVILRGGGWVYFTYHIKWSREEGGWVYFTYHSRWSTGLEVIQNLWRFFPNQFTIGDMNNPTAHLLKEKKKDKLQ